MYNKFSFSIVLIAREKIQSLCVTPGVGLSAMHNVGRRLSSLHESGLSSAIRYVQYMRKHSSQAASEFLSFLLFFSRSSQSLFF